MDGKQLMYDALRTQCKAEKAEAEFTLNNYMMNSVGIASATDKLENLERFRGKETKPF